MTIGFIYRTYLLNEGYRVFEDPMSNSDRIKSMITDNERGYGSKVLASIGPCVYYK